MPANFLEDDINHILSGDVFGEDDGCLWNGVQIEDVIFDDEHVEVETGQGITQIIPQPVITGRTSDFLGIADGDTINVRGETLTVRNWKADGTGMIEIFLSREAQT